MSFRHALPLQLTLILSVAMVSAPAALAHDNAHDNTRAKAGAKAAEPASPPIVWVGNVTPRWDIPHDLGLPTPKPPKPAAPQPGAPDAAGKDPVAKLPARLTFPTIHFRPRKIGSLDLAAKVFDAENLARLKKQVDFDKRYVLIFEWRGSSGDQFSYVVINSTPEQVRFRFRGGRQKDLRKHLHIYSVRKDVRYGFADRPDPKTNPGAERFDAVVSPSKPYLLPDKRTRLTIKEDTWWKQRQRGGYPQLQNDELTLAIVPNTVVALGGYLYYLDPPKRYAFAEIREDDTILTTVGDCTFSVLREKARPPKVPLRKLQGYVSFYCDNRSPNAGGLLTGRGHHFVALRAENVQVYRHGNAKEAGPTMDAFVVTNFGVKKVRLEYKQTQTLTLGPQTITIQSISYHHPSRSTAVKIQVTPNPDVKEPVEAVILKYGTFGRF